MALTSNGYFVKKKSLTENFMLKVWDLNSFKPSSVNTNYILLFSVIFDFKLIQEKLWM